MTALPQSTFPWAPVVDLRAPKSLRANYGADDRVAHNNTVKALISPGERPQEIYTPQEIVDALLVLWPQGVELDPCSGPDSIVPARVRFFGRLVSAPTVGNPQRMKWAGEGLTTPWVPRTYVNSPYDTLEQWLAKTVAEYRRGVTEIVQLAPVRTQRTWWRAAKRACPCLIWLDPLAFVGFEQSFPQALCLLYFGPRPNDFVSAFGHLGEVDA